MSLSGTCLAFSRGGKRNPSAKDRPMRRAGAVCALAIVASLSVNKASGDEGTSSDFRLWTDAVGIHQAKATLVEVKDRRVIVRRPDGRLAAVDIDRLSEDDKSYIE